MSHLILSDLRRLYHHVENGGKWDYSIDNRRLSKAISTIEELSEGGCRYNCTTGKTQFARGAEWAVGFLPDGWEAAFTELKGREKWKTTSGNKHG